MVPSGDITEKTIEQLGELLGTGDTVIDGGNSQDASFAGKVIAALRKEFGGHETRKPADE